MYWTHTGINRQPSGSFVDASHLYTVYETKTYLNENKGLKLKQ